MAHLQAEQLLDLLAATDEHQMRFKFSEIAVPLQKYIAVSKLIRKGRVDFQGGDTVKWTVMVSTSGRAKNTGLFGVDDVNVGDTLQQCSIGWKHSTVNWAIERREMSMNTGSKQIIDLKEARRQEAMIDWAKLEEDNYWADLTATGTDVLRPYGIDYWFTRSDTEGFEGGNHSSFSGGPGGLSCSTYPNWKLYNAKYTAVTKTDFVRKLRKAAELTRFTSPAPNVRELTTGDDLSLYTTYDTISLLEEVAEAQNDRLGNDIASMDGQVMFRRRPIEWVPWLQTNDSAAAPFYGINWGTFKCAFLVNEYMVESPWRIRDSQHTVFAKFMDCTRNWYMVNRRDGNFILHKGASL